MDPADVNSGVANCASEEDGEEPVWAARYSCDMLGLGLELGLEDAARACRRAFVIIRAQTTGAAIGRGREYQQ